MTLLFASSLCVHKSVAPLLMKELLSLVTLIVFAFHLFTNDVTQIKPMLTIPQPDDANRHCVGSTNIFSFQRTYQSTKEPTTLYFSPLIPTWSSVPWGASEINYLVPPSAPPAKKCVSLKSRVCHQFIVVVLNPRTHERNNLFVVVRLKTRAKKIKDLCNCGTVVPTWMTARTPRSTILYRERTTKHRSLALWRGRDSQITLTSISSFKISDTH